jgi:hypothetical protein
MKMEDTDHHAGTCEWFGRLRGPTPGTTGPSTAMKVRTSNKDEKTSLPDTRKVPSNETSTEVTEALRRVSAYQNQRKQENIEQYVVFETTGPNTPLYPNAGW